MVGFNTNSFITSVVGVSVGVVVFAMVALPIISSATAGLDPEDDANLIAIINVIPIFVAIGILMACVYMFISKKA